MASTDVRAASQEASALRCSDVSRKSMMPNTTPIQPPKSKRDAGSQNPYAYAQDDPSPEPASFIAPASAADIASSRALLDNPYAHLGGDGGYEALALASSSREQQPPLEGQRRLSAEPIAPINRGSPRVWDNQEIETRVRELQVLLWKQRAELFPDDVSDDPVKVLDPATALHMLGFDFSYVEGLGQMSSSEGPVEIGGLIDSKGKRVRVARQFSPAVRKFTAAHELGHAMLHADHLSVLHQDKPLDGVKAPRSRTEVEANKFATLFLMPAKLVAAQFTKMFLIAPFELTQDTAFALLGSSAPSIRTVQTSKRDLARLLAGTDRFNGRSIEPLHSRFGVSRETMAIRLEELALVSG
jgi:hypothetical protein